MVSPAAVAKITNFQLQVLVKLGSTPLRPILLNFLLDLTRVKQLKLEIGDFKDLCQLVVTLAIATTLLLVFELVLNAHLL